MTKEQLEVLWTSIHYHGVGEFEYRLLSPESIPSLNIGVDSQNRRSLVLELPNDYERTFQQHDRENLSLKYFSNEKCLCIVLNDNYYDDLFDDLILSIYSKIHFLEEVDTYSLLLVQQFNKWSSFFEAKHREGLDKEEVKGLFGELLVLQELILNQQMHINDILNAWRGPYDEGHDFVFENKDWEIKTVENGKELVKISSEYQLSHENMQLLSLIVITVKSDSPDGITLEMMANDVRSRILLLQGDLTVFTSALWQLGIRMNELAQYNMYRFSPVSKRTYDCNDDFPCIIRNGLHEALVKVRYSLRLDLIDMFKIEEIIY